jgi:hypothetical protein
MDGTQRPINIAALVSPLKYKISEKIRDRKAAINNKISVIVNFLFIILNFLCQRKKFQKVKTNVFNSKIRKSE